MSLRSMPLRNASSRSTFSLRRFIPHPKGSPSVGQGSPEQSTLTGDGTSNTPGAVDDARHALEAGQEELEQIRAAVEAATAVTTSRVRFLPDEKPLAFNVPASGSSGSQSNHGSSSSSSSSSLRSSSSSVRSSQSSGSKYSQDSVNDGSHKPDFAPTEQQPIKRRRPVLPPIVVLAPLSMTVAKRSLGDIQEDQEEQVPTQPATPTQTAQTTQTAERKKSEAQQPKRPVTPQSMMSTTSSLYSTDTQQLPPQPHWCIAGSRNGCLCSPPPLVPALSIRKRPSRRGPLSRPVGMQSPISEAESEPEPAVGADAEADVEAVAESALAALSSPWSSASSFITPSLISVPFTSPSAASAASSLYSEFSCSGCSVDPFARQGQFYLYKDHSLESYPDHSHQPQPQQQQQDMRPPNQSYPASIHRHPHSHNDSGVALDDPADTSADSATLRSVERAHVNLFEALRIEPDEASSLREECRQQQRHIFDFNTGTTMDRSSNGGVNPKAAANAPIATTGIVRPVSPAFCDSPTFTQPRQAPLPLPRERSVTSPAVLSAVASVFDLDDDDQDSSWRRRRRLRPASFLPQRLRPVSMQRRHSLTPAAASRAQPKRHYKSKSLTVKSLTVKSPTFSKFKSPPKTRAASTAKTQKTLAAAGRRSPKFNKQLPLVPLSSSRSTLSLLSQLSQTSSASRPSQPEAPVVRQPSILALPAATAKSSQSMRWTFPDNMSDLFNKLMFGGRMEVNETLPPEKLQAIRESRTAVVQQYLDAAAEVPFPSPSLAPSRTPSPPPSLPTMQERKEPQQKHRTLQLRPPSSPPTRALPPIPVPVPAASTLPVQAWQNADTDVGDTPIEPFFLDDVLQRLSAAGIRLSLAGPDVPLPPTLPVQTVPTPPGPAPLAPSLPQRNPLRLAGQGRKSKGKAKGKAKSRGRTKNTPVRRRRQNILPAIPELVVTDTDAAGTIAKAAPAVTAAAAPERKSPSRAPARVARVTASDLVASAAAATAADENNLYFPVSPCTMVMPTVRHGPIRLPRPDCGSEFMPRLSPDTLDWTAFQMAILGGAGDLFSGSCDYSSGSGGSWSAEAEDLVAWFDAMEVRHERLVPEAEAKAETTTSGARSRQPRLPSWPEPMPPVPSSKSMRSARSESSGTVTWRNTGAAESIRSFRTTLSVDDFPVDSVQSTIEHWRREMPRAGDSEYAFWEPEEKGGRLLTAESSAAAVQQTLEREPSWRARVAASGLSAMHAPFEPFEPSPPPPPQSAQPAQPIRLHQRFSWEELPPPELEPPRPVPKASEPLGVEAGVGAGPCTPAQETPPPLPPRPQPHSSHHVAPSFASSSSYTSSVQTSATVSPPLTTMTSMASTTTASHSAGQETLLSPPASAVQRASYASYDSYESMPQSPLGTFSRAETADGSVVVVPMGHNLSHDLGSYLRWEAENVCLRNF